MSGRDSHDFSQGKIYKIYSQENEDLGYYVGSTCLSLQRRLNEHKNAYRKYLKENKPIERSRCAIQFGDAVIELIESYPCQNREQLETREYEIIRKCPSSMLLNAMRR